MCVFVGACIWCVCNDVLTMMCRHISTCQHMIAHRHVECWHVEMCLHMIVQWCVDDMSNVRLFASMCIAYVYWGRQHEANVCVRQTCVCCYVLARLCHEVCLLYVIGDMSWGMSPICHEAHLCAYVMRHTCVLMSWGTLVCCYVLARLEAWGMSPIWSHVTPRLDIWSMRHVSYMSHLKHEACLLHVTLECCYVRARLVVCFHVPCNRLHKCV